METQQNPPTEVLYNAACPVCRREIEHYAEIAAQQDLPIRFDDLNAADALAGWRLESDTAARRLHVRQGDTVLSGIPAFILLWQEIPRYRWLARIVSLPGVKRLAIWTYDGILAPLLYRWHRFRIR